MPITAKIDYAKIDESAIGVLLSSFSESSGYKDSLTSKHKDAQHLDAESIGFKDSISSKFVYRFRSFNENLGFKDVLAKFVQRYRMFSERSGFLGKARHFFGVLHIHKYADSPAQQVETEE